MYYVYILKLSDNTFYIGFSANLTARIDTHKNNQVSYTSHKNPELVFYCAFIDKLLALNFEKYLKSSSGFAFRNKRLILKI